MPLAALDTYLLGGLMPAFNAEDALTQAFGLKPSTTFRKGDAVGEITATPGVLGLYASGNSDGTENPRGLMEFDCVVDASGNIAFTTAVAVEQFGQTRLTAPVWIEGYFNTADLPQSGAGSLDAAGLAKLGRQVNGTLVAGVIHVR